MDGRTLDELGVESTPDYGTLPYKDRIAAVLGQHAHTSSPRDDPRRPDEHSLDAFDAWQ